MIIQYTTPKGEKKTKVINPANLLSWQRLLQAKGCHSFGMVY